MARKGQFKRYLERELKKDIRTRYTKKIRALRKQAREAKTERKRLLREAKTKCDARMGSAIARAQRAFEKTYATDIQRQKAQTKRRNAEREARVKAAREKCHLDARSIIAETEATIGAAKKEETEERRFRREMEHGERALRKQRRARRGPAKRARAIRVQESEDLARANIPKHLHGLWERKKHRMKGSPKLSRSEQFMLYVHEHPEEVARLGHVPSDIDFAAEEAAWHAQQGTSVDEFEEVPF